MPEPQIICPSCAGSVASAKFCSECGATLSSSPASLAAAALPPPPPPVGSAPAPSITPTAGGGVSGRTAALVGGALAVLVLIVVIAVAMTSSKHTIHGTMTLFDLESDFGDSSGGCAGSGGYDDIHEGAPVVVKDENDKVIATGELTDSDGTGGLCTFNFVIEDVPDANFYSVGAGSDSRGGVRYSKEDMKDNDWEVGLTLGD